MSIFLILCQKSFLFPSFIVAKIQKSKNVNIKNKDEHLSAPKILSASQLDCCNRATHDTSLFIVYWYDVMILYCYIIVLMHHDDANIQKSKNKKQVEHLSLPKILSCFPALLLQKSHWWSANHIVLKLTSKNAKKENKSRMRILLCQKSFPALLLQKSHSADLWEMCTHCHSSARFLHPD